MSKFRRFICTGALLGLVTSLSFPAAFAAVVASPPAYHYDCAVVIGSESAQYERHHTYSFDNNTTQIQLRDVADWTAYDPTDLTRPIDPKTAAQDAAEKNFDGHTLSLVVAPGWDDVKNRYTGDFEVTLAINLAIQAGQKRSDVVSSSFGKLTDSNISSSATFRSYLQDDFEKFFDSLSIAMKCVKH
jgi:hypothetical protein